MTIDFKVEEERHDIYVDFIGWACIISSCRNLIFDAVLPFGEHITEAEAARQIRERVRQMDGGEYYAVVTVENPYV